MNFNTSPIAFYTNRSSQPFRASYRQKEIAVQCGETLLPFYIPNVSGDAPTTCELYDPNTDTLIATLTCSPHLLTHITTVNGVSVKFWIYQGTQSGIFGNSKQGYFYLKIGSYYSDIFRVGALPAEYTEVSWQFFDDIITVDGSLISKYVVYKQIFNVPLWKPTYNVEEEGKTNNGVFFAMQQTTKKTCGFSAIVNEAQADVMNLARMADFINVKSCINGQIKEFQSNQFEITVKWESDDVAHIEAEFDLFNIVRKYQLSETAPEPLPIPVPPPPPSNYKIKGTLTENVGTITMRINGTTETISCANKAFEYGYDSEATGEIEFITNKDKIKTLDFSESCGLGAITRALFNLPNLTTINLSGCTFESVTSAENMFANSKLTSVSMPNATFAACTNTNSMFYVTEQMQTISIPLARFQNVDDIRFMFCACWATSIDLPIATFTTATQQKNTFSEVKASAINMPVATFLMLQDCSGMFWKGTGDFVLSSVFPSFYAAPTNVENMFAEYNGNITLTGLDCSQLTTGDKMFINSTATTIVLPNNINGITSAKQMFEGCAATIGHNVLFTNVTDATRMFAKHANVSLGTYAFLPNVITAEELFAEYKGETLTISGITFANATNCDNMIYNCTALKRAYLESATFASLPASAAGTTHKVIGACNELLNLSFADSGTGQMGSKLATEKFTFDLRIPKLNFQGLRYLLEYVCYDLNTNDQVNEIIILTSAWNNFDATQKSTINSALAALQSWKLTKM